MQSVLLSVKKLASVLPSDRPRRYGLTSHTPQADASPAVAGGASRAVSHFAVDDAALSSILNNTGVSAGDAVPKRQTMASYSREEFATKASSLFHGALRVPKREGGAPAAAQPGHGVAGPQAVASHTAAAPLAPTTPSWRTPNHTKALSVFSSRRRPAPATDVIPRRLIDQLVPGVIHHHVGSATAQPSPQVTHFSHRDWQRELQPVPIPSLSFVAAPPKMQAMSAEQDDAEMLPVDRGVPDLTTLAQIEAMRQQELQLERELEEELRRAQQLAAAQKSQEVPASSVSSTTIVAVPPSTPKLAAPAPRRPADRPAVLSATLLARLKELQADVADGELEAIFLQAAGRSMLFGSAVAVRTLDNPLAEHLTAQDALEAVAETTEHHDPGLSPHRFRPLVPCRLG